MHLTVEPSTLAGGRVTVPGDKSISHRALMLGAIADGTTTVSGFLNGEDCLATMEALRDMGVQIEQPGDTDVVIHGRGPTGLVAPAGSLDMGNSGTAMRLMAGLLAAQPFDVCLIGDESLSQRPMSRIIGPLEEMGAHIGSQAGRPPLVIRGGNELHGIEYEMPVASAQVKSALLLAGIYAQGETAVIEPATTRDHTERMLSALGAAVTVDDSRISIAGGQRLTGCALEVPADLSSAAFVMLAALLADECELTIENVGVNPTRTGVLDVLRNMGADIELQNTRQAGGEPLADIVVRSSRLRGIEVDPAVVSLAIDEFPVLFIAASAAEGRTVFTGIGELRVKESDRIAVMATGLRRLGIRVDESADGATVYGGSLTGGEIDSMGDHRIAMSFAIAGLTAAGGVRINDAAAVATSFPGFSASLAGLGAAIQAHEGAR